MQQQAKIKQHKMAAPIKMMASVVDITSPPASSTSNSKSFSSSTFVAATMIKLIFQFCDQDQTLRLDVL